jgi:S1-C subfamily serine protease
MVKELLSRKGVSFKEIDVSRDQYAAAEMVKRTGQTGVPVTLINGQLIIGYDQAKLEQEIGRIQKASFGAAVADADKVTGQKGLPLTAGAYIGRIRPDSVAERLKLQVGDIIVEINKQRINSASDLEYAVSGLTKGSRVFVLFKRGDEERATEDFY